jgi:hypothetical protein
MLIVSRSWRVAIGTSISANVRRISVQTKDVFGSINAATNPVSISSFRDILKTEVGQRGLPIATAVLEDFYVPLYIYLKNLISESMRTNTYKSEKKPLFVGVSAPQVAAKVNEKRRKLNIKQVQYRFFFCQGCGKTTLTTSLQALFAAEGLKCIAISIDDFYLTGVEQDALADKYPSNPLLKYRGNGERTATS